MNIEIEPKSAQKKYRELIQETVERFLTYHNVNPDAAVSIHFVGENKIKDLNRKFRKIDTPTDVLSFPIWENLGAIPKNGPVNLGDIFICESELKEDLGYIVEHALNHLVGKHH